jgi:hypothetical protein
MLSDEKIVENWNDFIKIVEESFPTRKDAILKMYKENEMRIATAPASGTEHFHNAFKGGYIDHVLRVIDFSKKVANLWAQTGLKINFTKEELIFAAMHHDLGKIGLPGEGMENYIENSPDDWWRRNRGKIYNNNNKVSYHLIQDRSLFLLQHYGIPCSENEYFAIKLHDGLYDDTNKPYYMSSNPETRLSYNIVFVLHQADLMAAKLEYEIWENKKNKNVDMLEKDVLNKLFGGQ